jgi:hypothetical protein
MKENQQNPDTMDEGEMLDTLKILKRTGRLVGGVWVTGTMAGHRFDALVFPQHAEVESYELGKSKISKLWVKNTATGETVVNFDRGWDIEPTTLAARKIVDLLCAGLADTIFSR